MASSTDDVLARVLVELNDPQGANYPVSELYGYLNDGLRLLLQMQPSAFAAYRDIVLDPGSKTALPDDLAVLLDVVAVLDEGGNPARFPRQVDLMALSRHLPNWRAADPASMREWAYDAEKDPRTLWVNPPAADPGETIQIKFARISEPMDNGSELPVDERYEPALEEYIMARAYGKDTEHAGQDGRAAIHMNRFKELLGGKPG